jgi:sugar lactone lactonase YvrE
MSQTQTRILIDDLTFAEGPRWRDGFLYFSDFYDGVVKRVSLDAKSDIVAHVPTQPSGLGWLPDGRMLIVSMTDRQLMCLDATTLSAVSDLTALAGFHCNDMVVDAQGRAYIGNFGFNSEAGEQPIGTNLVLVRPGEAPVIAADDLLFPNGTVITPDGKTLIIGETYASRLTAFDIAADGSLSNRRLWADMSGLAPDNPPVPDGICLDEEGAIWVASPTTSEVLRLAEGGEVLQRVPLSARAFACMLGGPARKTLFICTANASSKQACISQRSGRIEMLEVDVAGIGLP